MKKKVVLIVALIVLASISITALCNEEILVEIEETFEPIFEFGTGGNAAQIQIEEPEFEEELFSSEENLELFGSAYDSVNFLDGYIAKNDFEEIDAKRIKNKFITTVSEYGMTDEEITCVSGLIKQNYDIEALLDIYEFLRYTNSDIDMIEEIYLAGEKNQEEDFWIYDTYDKLLDRKEDMLSVEDVAYYVGMGITPDEIVGAYELSFSGKKNTKQMLNERLEGATWNEISAEIIAKEPAVITDADEMTINEIMKIRNYSVTLRKDISEIAEIKDGKVKLKAEAHEEMNDRRKNKAVLIEEFDANLPKVEKEETVNKTTYTEKEPIVIEEEIFEEDYIEIEEAEEEW